MNTAETRCKQCGALYRKNTEASEELKKILKGKIDYVPSCKCHEMFWENQLKDMEEKSEEERKKNKGRKYMKYSITGAKFEESLFENGDMNDKNFQICHRYACSFLKKDVGIGLVLYGDVGTGKTFGSSCIANHLMNNGKSVFVINLGLYLNKLKSEWSIGEKEMLKMAGECDLLIIDDFGAEKVSDWVLEKVFLLIDERYRTGKPLIISTNLNYDKGGINCEIRRIFGKRIKDRIDAICFPVSYKGESKRKADWQKNLKMFIDK